MWLNFNFHRRSGHIYLVEAHQAYADKLPTAHDGDKGDSNTKYEQPHV